MKTATLDIPVDTLTESLRWTEVEKEKFPYAHSRDLPIETAQKAITYIAHITKCYPYQIRYAFAISLWKRFAREWCDTGDEQKALRVI